MHPPDPLTTERVGRIAVKRHRSEGNGRANGPADRDALIAVIRAIGANAIPRDEAA